MPVFTFAEGSVLKGQVRLYKSLQEMLWDIHQAVFQTPGREVFSSDDSLRRIIGFTVSEPLQSFGVHTNTINREICVNPYGLLKPISEMEIGSLIRTVKGRQEIANTLSKGIYAPN